MGELWRILVVFCIIVWSKLHRNKQTYDIVFYIPKYLLSIQMDILAFRISIQKKKEDLIHLLYCMCPISHFVSY